MARGNPIKVLRSTRANLDAQRAANGLIAGEPYLITDEGRFAVATAVNAYVDFARLSELTSALAQAPKGHIYGLTLSNNASDMTNDIDIAAGEAASDDGFMIRLPSSITKRLDAAWLVGSGNGGLDAGSIADGTYHVWVIQRSDTGVVDVLFSTSASAPTMPASYDRKRRIGSILRKSGAILAFSQRGDEFLWAGGPIADAASVAISSTASLHALTVPTGIKVDALFVAAGYNGSLANRLILISSPDQADVAPGATGQIGISAAGAWAPSALRIRTNTSGQVRARGDTTLALSIGTHGFIDRRGRD